jgi:hypothetical protein
VVNNNGVQEMNQQVDVLGRLLAEIDTLTKQAEAIKKTFKEGSEKVLEGDLFRATVITQERETTDWKALCKALGISDETVKGFVKTQTVVSLKVTSR